jgi:lysophospholipase L1-like esterase
MRQEVAAAVDVLRAHGDKHIHYVNGLDILGEEHEALLPDELHPSPDGYRLMGRNFLDKVTTQVQGFTGSAVAAAEP